MQHRSEPMMKGMHFHPCGFFFLAATAGSLALAQSICIAFAPSSSAAMSEPRYTTLQRLEGANASAVPKSQVVDTAYKKPRAVRRDSLLAARRRAAGLCTVRGRAEASLVLSSWTMAVFRRGKLGRKSHVSHCSTL